MVARKTSSNPTRIWRFGALKPDGDDYLILQAANDYRNKLIEAERFRMSEYQRIREKHYPDLTPLREQMEAANALIWEHRDAIKEWRAQEWKNTAKKDKEGKYSGGMKTLQAPLEMREAVGAAKKEFKKAAKNFGKRRAEVESTMKESRKELKDRIEAAKEACIEVHGKCGPRIKERINAEELEKMLAEPQWPDLWKELVALDAKALQHTKDLRDQCKGKISSGTYQLVERATAAAIKDRRPLKPKFHPYDGGRIGVQTKMTWGDLVKPGGVVQILPAPPKRKRKGKLLQNPEYRILKMRVGVGRHLQYPVRLHRQPPDDTLVKWVWVKCTRLGRRLHYELHFTLEHKDFGIKKRPVGVGICKAEEFCSRKTSSGAWTVAVINGETIDVSDRLKRRLESSKELQKVADNCYSEVLEGLGLGGLRSKDKRLRLRVRENFTDMLSVWGAEAVAPLDTKALWKKWKKQRLKKGHDLWCDQETAVKWFLRQGGADRTAGVAWWSWIWTRKEHHLAEYVAYQRRAAQHQRDNFFRQTAIRLATQYEILETDDVNLAEKKRRPDAEEETDEGRAARKLRQFLAPGRFREILRETFGSRHRLIPRERSGDKEESEVENAAE